jgi:hypothetical protein
MVNAGFGIVGKGAVVVHHGRLKPVDSSSPFFLAINENHAIPSSSIVTPVA